MSLAVSDRGVGMPKDFEISQSKSLGMRIIQLLTKQLEGVLVIGHESGTTFTVSFATNPNLQPVPYDLDNKALPPIFGIATSAS